MGLANAGHSYPTAILPLVPNPEPSPEQGGRLSKRQRWLLAGASLLLGVVVALLLGLGDTAGESKTTTEPVSTTVTTVIEPTTTEMVTSTAPASQPALGKSAASMQPSASVKTTTKRTSTEVQTKPTATRVTTTPGHGVLASDSLILLLVGLALALLLGAASGQRLKLGIAGTQVEVAPETRHRAYELTFARLPTADPALIQLVAHGAVGKLAEDYWGAPARPPDKEIKAAVEETLSTVGEVAPAEVASAETEPPNAAPPQTAPPAPDDS
jgi:hypothetical protein